MPTNPVLENVFGTIGAVLWSIQIIPQIWKSYRTKDVEGLSSLLMFIWAVACFFLGSYNIVQKLSIPLIIQPQTFAFLSFISVMQCKHYGPSHWKFGKCVLALVVFCSCLGGFEAGMFFALRAGQRNGTNAPILFMGIVSAILLAGALLPQYYEIYRYKEVKGLSLSFIIIDMLGGVFCILSLVFQAGEGIDILAAINYGLVVVLDGLVLVLAAVLNPRANKRRKAALEAAERDVDADEAETGSPRTEQEQEKRDRDVEAALRKEGGATTATTTTIPPSTPEVEVWSPMARHTREETHHHVI